MSENNKGGGGGGEEKLIAVARHIAKTLGHSDSMTDDILQIFSTFDGRFSREKLSDSDPTSAMDPSSSPAAALEGCLSSIHTQMSHCLSSDTPVWSDPAESAAFLDAFDDLVATIRDFTPLGAEVGPALDRAEDLLQQALFRLQELFRGLIQRGTHSSSDSRDLNAATSLESDGEEEEEEEGWDDESDGLPVAHPVTDFNILIDLLPGPTINDLHEIARRMVGVDYGRECAHVYSACRREFLEESLARLGLQKLSTDEVQKLPWHELEDEIERWCNSAVFSLKILFPSERRLVDRVFVGLPGTADLTFMEVCRGAATQLLNFADAVGMSSRSPERLFKVLDVYETLRDLVPEFEVLFSDQYCVVLRNEVVAIWRRVGEAVRGIFMELENLIRRDPAKSAVPGGGLHPITRYVMNYLRAACKSRQTLEQVFEEDRDHRGLAVGSSLSVQMAWIMELENLIRRDPAKSAVPGGGLHPITRYVMNYLRAACKSRQTLEQVFEEDRDHRGLAVGSSLSVQMAWIMELLESNLEAKSKIYRDVALSSVFMMNNGRYIVQKVKDNELGMLLGDDWVRKHNAKIRQFHVNYQRSSWNRVMAVLKPENNSAAGGPNSNPKPLRDRLKMFTTQFDETLKAQSSWVIFDDQLREQLRMSVLENMLPAYRNFIAKFQSSPEAGRNPEKHIKYSVEDIETRINNDLFQGNPGRR